MSILDMFKLDGKVALVTGASRGLGRSIAIGLAEAGADIVGLSRSDDDNGMTDAVGAFGQRYEHIALDLATASTEALQGVITTAIEKMGRLDILVNNAGVVRRKTFLEFGEDDWDFVLQVNLKVAFLLSQAAARHMKEHGGGKIIQVASLLSYQGGFGVMAYASSKHGIMGLTKAMANELAPYHINVNGIAPGYMATDLNVALREDETRNREIVERIPVGHWGHGDDLKGAAVYLASAAADYVHGTTLAVDGGWLSR